MRCPRCNAEFELPKELADTGCPECLWVPVDSVKELLAILDQPGTPEWRHSIGYLGQGTVLALAQLGFVSAQDARRWTERLLTAADIEWEQVEHSSTVAAYLEAEEDPASEEASEENES